MAMQEPVKTQNGFAVKWYMVIGALAVVTALAIVFFAGPLDTSPEQELSQTTQAGQE